MGARSARLQGNSVKRWWVGTDRPPGRKGLSRTSTLLLLGLLLATAIALRLLVPSSDGDDTSQSAGHEAPGTGLKEVLASFWAVELKNLFNITPTSPDWPPREAAHNLGDVLDRIQEQGVNVIFTSSAWGEVEAAPGEYNFAAQDFVQRAVCSRGLKYILLLDACNAPPWLFARYPEAVVVDSKDALRGGISFLHQPAMVLFYRWVDASLARLAEVAGTCIHSISFTFNNEYESKYIQEYDAFQDYSAPAKVRYRQYFQNIREDLTFWNERWGTQFGFWSAVDMPKHYQHAVYQYADVHSLRYWDWQHFREHMLKDAYEAGCIRIAAHGFKCTMHFGEFFAGSDAIYASGIFFSLTRSPWMDYAVVDSNFMTIWGEPNDPRIAQLLLAAARPLATPTFFEGAFERTSDMSIHVEAVRLTAASQTHGVAFTNWMTRVPDDFFSTVLSGAMTVAPLLGLPVAVVTPYRSYYGVKGMDPATKTDVMQSRLFSCLDDVEAMAGSLDGLQVFGQPAALLPVLHEFHYVWYLEPAVLLSGDRRTVEKIKERAEELGIQFIVKPSPVPPTLIDECCNTF